MHCTGPKREKPQKPFPFWHPHPNKSSWRCTACREKYEKKQAARELRKLTALKKKSNPKEIEVAVENIKKKQIWCFKQVCQAMF